MRSHKEVTLTRKQIYDLVWSRPMRDVARELGFSDVGLKKLCRRNGIPTPPQGYHLMGTGAEKARLLKPLPDALSRQQEKFYFRVPDLAVEEARDAAKLRAQAAMNETCRSLTNTERAEIR